uniref:DUF4283 domain-containing protein n=1 Tax=Manihot esculenta TaxID=3983 RepID=A0A2C9U923_MANES
MDVDALIAQVTSRLQLEEERGRIKYCLVGRVLTDKPINFAAFEDMMASVWIPGKGMVLKDLGNNAYLFQFFHAYDIETIMLNGPWNFSQILILLKELNPHENPKTAVAQTVGTYLGEFIKSDSNNYTGFWKEYMCVRINIDIRQPLKRRMQLSKRENDWFWVDFKYERLPIFCYFCAFRSILLKVI